MVLLVVIASVGVYEYLKLNRNISRVDALVPDDPAIRDAAAQDGSDNLLIVGSDTRAGANGAFEQTSGEDSGQRSDTMILAHVPADRSRLVLVSLPRDSWVRIPTCGKAAGSWATLNAALERGGPKCAVRTVQALTGVVINHYLQVDFTGFSSVVDALGGVDFCSDTDAYDKASGLRLRRGWQRLDGTQALALARARKEIGDGSDLGRIGRQQQLIRHRRRPTHHARRRRPAASIHSGQIRRRDPPPRRHRPARRQHRVRVPRRHGDHCRLRQFPCGRAFAGSTPARWSAIVGGTALGAAAAGTFRPYRHARRYLAAVEQGPGHRGNRELSMDDRDEPPRPRRRTAYRQVALLFAFCVVVSAVVVVLPGDLLIGGAARDTDPVLERIVVLLVSSALTTAGITALVWLLRRTRRGRTRLAPVLTGLTLADRRQVIRALRDGTPSPDPHRADLERRVAERHARSRGWGLAVLALAAIFAACARYPSTTTTGRWTFGLAALMCVASAIQGELQVRRARRYLATTRRQPTS